jgi:hypothetical protein
MPQSPQKRLDVGLSAPHFGQAFASAAPQSPQNFLPAGFSTPHFEQRIGAFPLRDLTTLRMLDRARRKENPSVSERLAV